MVASVYAPIGEQQQAGIFYLALAKTRLPAIRERVLILKKHLSDFNPWKIFPEIVKTLFSDNEGEEKRTLFEALDEVLFIISNLERELGFIPAKLPSPQPLRNVSLKNVAKELVMLIEDTADFIDLGATAFNLPHLVRRSAKLRKLASFIDETLVQRGDDRWL